MDQKDRLKELILVVFVIGLVIWNYYLTSGNFALPHKVAMYSLKPVTQNDRGLLLHKTDNMAANAEKFHSVLFSDTYSPDDEHAVFDFHHMTNIQVSKYVLGCYGAIDWMHMGSAEHVGDSWDTTVDKPWVQRPW